MSDVPQTTGNDFHDTQLNEVFIDLLEDPEMKKEAEQRASEFLKVQIYEDSFLERILPAQPITPAQCDRTVDHPNYTKVIDKEFADVTATTLGFRGRSDYQYVEADRYQVNFFKIESEEYEITEGELRGMQQPLQNLIRHHIAYHIRKKMDEAFIGLVDKAIAQDPTNQRIDKSSSGEGTITPELIVELRNLLDGRNINGRYMEASTLLMSRPQYNRINEWAQQNSAGTSHNPGMTSGLGTEFWRDGYEYDMLQGLRVVTTVKTDIIPENEIYCFSPPDLMGHHFTFNDDRFSIIREHDRMRWKGWRTFGMAIGNNYSCTKLILDPDA